MNLAYTFTIGPGELSKKGIFLLRSIEKNTSATKDDIFVYLVEEEKENIEEEIINEVREKATIIEGEMPNQEYPLSAAHAALFETSKETDKEYLLLLDTDTLVLDDIRIHENKDHDLFIAPEGLKRTYWASKESEEELKKVFEEYGFNYPNQDLKSNYRGVDINPIYNSGVILTRNNEFPKRYLELSREIHGNLPKYNYFSDMISLSLLASDYQVYNLGPQYNFFQRYRPYPQEGTKIVHYIDFRSLFRGIILSEKAGSGWFRQKIDGIGVEEEYRRQNKITRGFKQLLEAYYSYNCLIKERASLNFVIRKKLIRILELTKTKDLARKIANTLLRKQKFPKESYK